MTKLVQSVIVILFTTQVLYAQSPITFSFSNSVKFLKENGTDTLRFPFAGGLNAPQFSNIDLDGDGKKDLFVFDRIGNVALTFLWKNNRWEYAPQYQSMFPRLFNWVFMRDGNCDGKEDVFTEVDLRARPEADKYVTPNGIRVLKNETTSPGNLVFKQYQNQLYDTGFSGMPPTALNYSNQDIGAIEDIDNDGDIDMLRIPYLSYYIEFFENVRNLKGYSCDSMTHMLRCQAWGEMIYLILHNRWQLHDSTVGFIKNYLCKGGGMHINNSISLFDMDGDGDQDLLYGDGAYPNLQYLQNGKNLCPTCPKDSFITTDTIFPRNTFRPLDFNWPTAYFFDADADGVKDMVITTNEPIAAKNVGQVCLYKNNPVGAVANFSFVQNNFLQDEMIDHGGQSNPVFVDIDSDGDEDLVVSTKGNWFYTQDNNDRLVLYKNVNTRQHPVFQLADTNFLNVSAGQSAGFFDIRATFGDLTGDGKKDLVIGDFNGYIHFYQNTSSANTVSFNKISDDYFSIFCGVNTSPQLVDLNKDGKLDLVIGRKNGTIAYYENSGSTTSPQFSAKPTIDSLGKVNVSELVDVGSGNYVYDDRGYSTPFVYDFNNDGIYEMAVGSRSNGVHFFLGVRADKNASFPHLRSLFKDNPAMAEDSINHGSFLSLGVANLDADTLPDLMIGNQRGGLRFYKTSISGSLSSVVPVSDAKLNLKVYPNPANGTLNIERERMNEGLEVTLINILGETLQQIVMRAGEQQQHFDVSAFPSGLYFVKARSQNGRYFTERILVSH